MNVTLNRVEEYKWIGNTPEDTEVTIEWLPSIAMFRFFAQIYYYDHDTMEFELDTLEGYGDTFQETIADINLPEGCRTGDSAGGTNVKEYNYELEGADVEEMTAEEWIK